MNIFAQIQVKREPLLFFNHPVPLVMASHEITYLPALMSELVDMSIEKVAPVEHVGRVLIFDVTPLKVFDPRLIFCRGLKLGWYYHIWKRIVSNILWGDERRSMLKWYGEETNSLLIDSLNVDEAAFLLMELLRFKNEYIRR